MINTKSTRNARLHDTVANPCDTSIMTVTTADSSVTCCLHRQAREAEPYASADIDLSIPAVL